MKVKEENEKAGLKLSIQKTKIMISSPITSWQIDGETMKSVTDFIFGGSKITEDGCLLLEKTKLDSILKSRDITDKGLSSQSYVFSRSHVWMWELDHKEGWAPKNWCFWTVVLENTHESPLDSKEIKPVNSKGNQFWLFLEGLMLKLKLQYFGHLMGGTDSLEKTLMLRKIKGRRRRGRQRMKWLDGIYSMPTQWKWVWASLGNWWRTGKPGVLQSVGTQRVRHDWATEQQQQPHRSILRYQSKQFLTHSRRFALLYNSNDYCNAKVMSRLLWLTQTKVVKEKKKRIYSINRSWVCLEHYAFQRFFSTTVYPLFTFIILNSFYKYISFLWL